MAFFMFHDTHIGGFIAPTAHIEIGATKHMHE